MRFVIRIQGNIHSEYLRGGPTDPVSHEPIQNDDQVIVCAICKLVFLIHTWDYLDGRHCNQIKTLPQLPPPRVISTLGSRQRTTGNPLQPHPPSPPTQPRPSRVSPPAPGRITPVNPRPPVRQPTPTSQGDSRLKITKKEHSLPSPKPEIGKYIVLLILLVLLLLLFI